MQLEKQKNSFFFILRYSVFCGGGHLGIDIYHNFTYVFYYVVKPFYLIPMLRELSQNRAS